MAQKTIVLDYEPQPKQALLHKCHAKQILFGGAAGACPALVRQSGASL